MIDITFDPENNFIKTNFHGRTQDIAAEFGFSLCTVYKAIRAQSPEDAAVFKNLIEEQVTNPNGIFSDELCSMIPDLDGESIFIKLPQK